MCGVKLQIEEVDSEEYFRVCDDGGEIWLYVAMCSSWKVMIQEEHKDSRRS